MTLLIGLGVLTGCGKASNTTIIKADTVSSPVISWGNTDAGEQITQTIQVGAPEMDNKPEVWRRKQTAELAPELSITKMTPEGFDFTLKAYTPSNESKITELQGSTIMDTKTSMYTYSKDANFKLTFQLINSNNLQVKDTADGKDGFFPAGVSISGNYEIQAK